MSISIRIVRSQISQSTRHGLEAACSERVAAEQFDLFDSVAWAALDSCDEDDVDPDRGTQNARALVA